MILNKINDLIFDNDFGHKNITTDREMYCDGNGDYKGVIPWVDRASRLKNLNKNNNLQHLRDQFETYSKISKLDNSKEMIEYVELLQNKIDKLS